MSNREITTMTKTLTIAALFLAGSAATTAALMQEPPVHQRPVHSLETTVATDQEDMTRRGSREPLISSGEPSNPAIEQPRRGERPDIVAVGDGTAAFTGDAIRRGSR
jgi:hypothetical protein